MKECRGRHALDEGRRIEGDCLCNVVRVLRFCEAIVHFPWGAITPLWTNDGVLAMKF